MNLYLECNMGASGNMLMAALYELLPDKAAFREKMENLGLQGVSIKYSSSTKCGITGTHISVEIDGFEEKSDDVNHHDNSQYHSNNNCDNSHPHDHSHEGNSHTHSHPHDHSHEDSHHHAGRRYGCKEIIDIIRSLDLPSGVIEDAVGVYLIIGEAEAKVHGTSVDEIHFHEVGSLDAVADVVGCSLLVEMLGVDSVFASPVHVGYGMVRCEHGILPVPAPATAEILSGIPMYSRHIEGELCTPTGAALLRRFVTCFGTMPAMVVNKIGYGMGTKDFKAANCLRAFLYEDATGSDSLNADTTEANRQDTICEISCNLDDMSPEAIGAAIEILFENGANDVFTTPIMMKKNRPATKLSCLCKEGLCDNITELIIHHTTTLGVRITKHHRKILKREVMIVKTGYGKIRIKKAQGFGITKLKPEYEDVLAAAKKHELPFQVVYNEAYDAARREN